MDKQRVIIGFTILTLAFCILFLLSGNSLGLGGSKENTDDLEAKYQALKTEMKKMEQERDLFQKKSNDLTKEQQTLAKNVESFIRAYFEYDSTTAQTMITRLQPYSTQKLIDDLKKTQLEEGGNPVASERKQEVSDLQIFFSPVTNTNTEVIAKVSTLFQGEGNTYTYDLLVELSLVYDTDKQAWLTDRVNIQPAIPEDR